MARIVCVEKGTQIQVDDQKRYSHERKPIASLELSVSLTRSHTVIHSLRISLYISPSLPLSLISGVGRGGGGGKNRSFDLPVPTSYLSCCSSLHFAYIFYRSQNNKKRYNKRDTRVNRRKHCFTATVSRPFDDKIVVESAPLFLYLRSTRCPRAPRRARERVMYSGSVCSRVSDRPFTNNTNRHWRGVTPRCKLSPSRRHRAFLLPCTPCVRFRYTHDLPDNVRVVIHENTLHEGV